MSAPARCMPCQNCSIGLEETAAKRENGLVSYSRAFRGPRFRETLTMPSYVPVCPLD